MRGDFPTESAWWASRRAHQNAPEKSKLHWCRITFRYRQKQSTLLARKKYLSVITSAFFSCQKSPDQRPSGSKSGAPASSATRSWEKFPPPCPPLGFRLLFAVRLPGPARVRLRLSPLLPVATRPAPPWRASACACASARPARSPSERPRRACALRAGGLRLFEQEGGHISPSEPSSPHPPRHSPPRLALFPARTAAPPRSSRISSRTDPLVAFLIGPLQLVFL